MPRLTSSWSFFIFLTLAVLAFPSYLEAQAPQLSTLSPASGPVGTAVTITGNNFGATGTVTFNGTAATPTSWTATLIVATVPTGASTGNVVVTVGGVPSNSVNFTVATANFTLTGNLATARMFHTSTLLDSGAVLVAGGVDGFAYDALSSAELYSPATGTFTTTGSLNTARIFNTATLLSNGQVLIAGGSDSNWNQIGTAELYNPASGTFTFTGALNTPRSSHTATVLTSGQVLIVGGCDSNGDYITSDAASSELYNPTTGTFVSSGNLNTARDTHTATLLNNGQVLIVGGFDSNSNVLSSAELYDPVAGTFTLTGSLNFGRAVHTATLLNNGLVLIAGGYDNNGNAVASAELYNSATGTFTVTGNMNNPRYDGAQGTLLNNGMVLLAGGQDNNGNTLASAELYNPAAGTFTVTGSMNSTRQSLTTTLLNNGQVLVAAGMDFYANVLNSAELYQPSTLTPVGLVSIGVSPSNPSVSVGATESFTATGTFSDNSTQSLASVTWNSSDNTIALIANDASNHGNAVAVATGSSTVSACMGSICGSTTMTVLPPPSITSLSPNAGPAGASVTIAGNNFGTTGSVTFNGTTATPTSWTARSIVVTVPTGASTGNVVVTVGGLASNGVAFTLNSTYGNGYQYRQTIVLRHSNVPNTDQTDFPVLISGVYSYLANVSNGGQVYSPNGYDIVFSLDPEGSTILDLEIDGYDPGTGTAAFWVRIPTLSHTVDTVIYLFYGDPNITLSQENKAGVWRNNYLSVYHLGNGTTVGLADSGSAGYTLAGSAAAVSGKIGGGAAFNGNPGTYLYHDSLPAYPSGASPVTLETWVKLASSTGGFDIVGYGANSSDGSRAALWWDGTNVAMEFENMGVGGPLPYDNNWHHVVGVYGGGALSTTTDELYLDGAPLSTGGAGMPAITTTEFKIGGIPTVTFCCALNGSVDEVRVSSGVRSADWVATEYANESSPSTFYTMESQATPSSAPTIQFLSPNSYPVGVPIVIQGYGFQPTQAGSTVTFNGVTATPTSWNDASIIVPVPTGATTGNVVVTVGGVTSNGVLFTVIARPTIATLSPGAGPVGASITITGTSFGATQGASTVAFNGMAASITSWSATSIVATVPTGATSGNVVVTVSGAPSPGVGFTVLAIPVVSSLSPAAGPVGTQVTIQGSNFGSTQGASTVSFNGAPASIVSWSTAQIIAVAPATVTTGPVTVVVNSVPSNANVVFTAYNPVITSLSPPSGPIYGTITINGSGFGASQTTSLGISFVTVSGTVTNAQSWSDTAIQVEIPYTTSGPVTVTMNGVTSNGVEFTVEARPAINSISPNVGTSGTVVMIYGSGFGSTQSTSAVAFNGAVATVNSWSDTEILAVVPATTSGPVSVTVAGITAQGPSFGVDNVVVLTNSNGYQTTYTSTMIGGVWHMLSAQGPGCSSCSIRNNVQNTYDSNGNLLTTTDANGNTVTYTYDGSNNVLSKSAQLNGTPVTTTYTYNSFGEVLTMTDPLGNTTTNTYDGNGNLLTVSSPPPNGQTPPSVTQFAYNTLGESTQITDPLNHITTLSYYSTGLIQSITDAQNNTTNYAYDARGNRTTVIDPINGSAHPTTFTYDIMNRLTGITYPNGTSGSFSYDYRGRRISATDQNGKTTTYAYDDADRLLSVTDPANNVTQYNHDTENNLVSITDANNHTTYFAYDAFGRVTQTTFPSSLVESYGYDPVGNLTSKIDRKGQTIQYVYDSLYRLTSKTYPDSTSANYVYDLVGKIQQVSDPTGTYGFAYDNMGRLIGTSTQYSFLPGHNFQSSYSYDAASNRTSLTAPDGSTNTYNYDTLNRLSTLTSSLTGQFGFSYDALSRRTQLTRPNGVSTNYTYDGLSHLLSVLHQTGSTTLDGAGYGYDYTGNRTSNTNYLNGNTSNYSYDAIYELLQATQGGSTTESYSYDAVGNRLSSLGINQYSYNASNELTSTSNGSYTYDANGNTLTEPSGKSYTWDFENRLTQAVVPGTETVAFRYDPFGRRVYKSSPNFTGIFAYDGVNLIETMNVSGNVVARYTETQNIDEPLAELRSGGSSYYEADGLGSITSLSNSAGAVANTYTYDSFGNVTNFTGTLSNPFRYTGREFDSETGEYFYRARYYEPVNGRFVSEDPIRFFGGMNFYAYVGNSPLNFTDAFGFCPSQKRCPTVPTHPGYANINANIRAAQSAPYALFSFFTLVRGHGQWDYKQNALLNDFGTLSPRPNPPSAYEDFGNFNYGATGAALGLSPEILLIGAGWQATQSHPESTGTAWQNIFTLAGADDFNDQIMIMEGYEYYELGCYK